MVWRWDFELATSAEPVPEDIVELEKPKGPFPGVRAGLRRCSRSGGGVVCGLVTYSVAVVGTVLLAFVMLGLSK